MMRAADCWPRLDTQRNVDYLFSQCRIAEQDRYAFRRRADMADNCPALRGSKHAFDHRQEPGVVDAVGAKNSRVMSFAGDLRKRHEKCRGIFYFYDPGNLPKKKR